MKSKTHLFSSVIATLLLAVSQLGAPATAQAAERPFKGRIQGTFSAAPTENPVVFASVARAAGLSTQIGSFTKVTSDALNVATGAVDGNFAMTAPNGDLLTGTYTGFVIPDPVTGTFSWLLDANITGGSGRFANATGTFVFRAEGTFSFSDGTLQGAYTETFEGNISY